MSYMLPSPAAPIITLLEQTLEVAREVSSSSCAVPGRGQKFLHNVCLAGCKTLAYDDGS